MPFPTLLDLIRIITCVDDNELIIRVILEHLNCFMQISAFLPQTAGSRRLAAPTVGVVLSDWLIEDSLSQAYLKRLLK